MASFSEKVNIKNKLLGGISKNNMLIVFLYLSITPTKSTPNFIRKRVVIAQKFYVIVKQISSVSLSRVKVKKRFLTFFFLNEIRYNLRKTNHLLSWKVWS